MNAHTDKLDRGKGVIYYKTELSYRVGDNCSADPRQSNDYKVQTTPIL